MGDANMVRGDEVGPSGIKNGEEGVEEHMEYAPTPFFSESMDQSCLHSPSFRPSSLLFTSQDSVTPLHQPDMIHIQSDKPKQDGMFLNNWKSILIKWRHGGNQVAIEGSWDNWNTREFLQHFGSEMTIMKVLPSGVYYCRFIVDGQWRCAPDMPQACDDNGNIFNFLDLEDHIQEINDNILDSEPSSPPSSYNNPSFSSEELNEKVPELPPVLLRTLNRPLYSRDSEQPQENPSPAILNHLCFRKESMGKAAFSSTQRFRKKYVTVVLYKSSKNHGAGISCFDS